MTGNDSLALLQQWRDHGDESAATELYRRYSDRLIGLARKRLSSRLARRVEAEEIADSAARTFFLRIRDGRLFVELGSDLWKVLAAITIRKTLGHVEFHTAGKRSIRAEDSMADSISVTPTEAISSEPDVGEVLALEEIRDRLLEDMMPAHQQIIRMRLEGFTTPEIAAEVGLGERMVNIVIGKFVEAAKRQLEDDVDPTP